MSLRSQIALTWVMACGGCWLPPHVPERQASDDAIRPPLPTARVEPVTGIDGRFMSVDSSKPAQRVCFEALPEGVATCSECDLACVKQMTGEDARCGPHQGMEVVTGMTVAALACDVPPVASGRGCCFLAHVSGGWDCMF